MEEKDDKDKKKHYVTNKSFYEALCVWKAEWLTKPAGQKPPVSDYIAECISTIAFRNSFKGNFMHYSYKQEMIADAIENCLMYLHNFKPERSTNAFAYITTIVNNAFIRRITKEKKQADTKDNFIRECNGMPNYSVQEHDTRMYSNTYVEYVRENASERIKKKKDNLPKKSKQKKPKKVGTLEFI